MKHRTERKITTQPAMNRRYDNISIILYITKQLFSLRDSYVGIR